MSRTPLREAELSRIRSVPVPAYDRTRLRPGIAHFGVGNFHRAHEAVFIDRLLHRPGNEQWGIVGIGLGDGDGARAKRDALREQQHLYTATDFAPDGTRSARVIGAMIGYLHTPSEPDAVLALLADPGVRIVSMTITEGGYPVDEAGEFRATDAVRADLDGTGALTVFGAIARALARRRDAGTPPFAVVSCDNLRGNGDTARAAVLGVAALLDPGLAAWIDAEAGFPNSMVDRIVPYVSADDRHRLNAATGVDDLLPVMSEAYLQWVIEDRFPSGRPDLAAVGVELRDDVRAFEQVKGRMLNASHVLLSYPSLLLGHERVPTAMADARIRALVEAYLERDAGPLVAVPTGLHVRAYAESIVARFANPAVDDQLLRIATDGSVKIPTFHTATAVELVRRGGDVRRVALLLACFERWLGGIDDAGRALDTTEPSLGEAGVAAARAGDGVRSIDTFASWPLDDGSPLTADLQRMRSLIAAAGVAAAIDAALI